MNLVELDIAIPKEFDEFVAFVAQVHPSKDIVIAGGALVDLYLGFPFRDVDVFVEDDDEGFNLEAFNQLMQEEFQVKDGPSRYCDAPFVYNGTYKGIEFDVVGCHRHINRIMDFDLRFRQFYYVNGKVYASQKALEDIQEKRLHIVALSDQTTISTFARIYDFADRYGFHMDEESRNLLLWYVNTQRLDVGVCLSIIDENQKVSAKTRESISEEFRMCGKSGELEYPDAPFPYHPSLEEKLTYFYNKTRKTSLAVGEFHALQSLLPTYQPMALPENFSFNIDEEELGNDRLIQFNRLKKADAHNRLRLLVGASKLWSESFQSWLAGEDPNPSPEVRDELFRHTDDVPSYFGFEEEAFHVIQSFNQFSTIRVVFTHEDAPGEEDLFGTLHHHVFCVQVYEEDELLVTIKMRKCENGTFTPAGFYLEGTEQAREYFWPLFLNVKNQLMDRYPQWFTFGDPELKAYKHPFSNAEHFFGWAGFGRALLDSEKDHPVLVPIQNLSKEVCYP